MGEHPNATAARALLEAFNNQDPDGIRARMAEDVKWHTIGGPTFEGLSALEDSMGGADGGFSITAEIHDIVANDEHVVALVEAHAEAGDQKFDYRTAEIMHMSDGKVTERWAFSDDTQAITDWFSQFM